MKTCYQNDKTYLIFGTGITGKSAIEFCIKNHINYYIADDDKNKLSNFAVDNILIEEDRKIYKYNLDILKEKKIDYIILSPSVHAEYQPHEIVLFAKTLNIEIIADIDLFFCYLEEYNKYHNTNKKIVGITGTNGKSTTVSLVSYLLTVFGKTSIACGNIGINPLAIDVDLYDYFIVEMSSYNLYLMKYCKFDYSVLLNISDDHLSYHGTMQNYVNAKKKIIQKSNNGLICCDDMYTTKICECFTQITKVSTKNVDKYEYYFSNNIFWKKNNMLFQGIFTNLIGFYNIQNIFCSVICVFNLLKDVQINNIFNAVKSFKGLPHRNQFVKNIDGVDFYNDSKGTNANSTQNALNVFKNRPIYLIAGGRRKTAGFYFLKNDLKDVKKVFLIGEATDSFAEELDDLDVLYVKCQTMKNAVHKAFIDAKKDDIKGAIVLLSPLCASWDQYSSFEERGDDFINIVNTL